MADPVRVPIGALRWPVRVARRRQNFEPLGVGIAEALGEIAPVRAEVLPMSAATFYGGMSASRRGRGACR